MDELRGNQAFSGKVLSVERRVANGNIAIAIRMLDNLMVPETVDWEPRQR